MGGGSWEEVVAGNFFLNRRKKFRVVERAKMGLTYFELKRNVLYNSFKVLSYKGVAMASQFDEASH